MRECSRHLRSHQEPVSSNRPNEWAALPASVDGCAVLAVCCKRIEDVEARLKRRCHGGTEGHGVSGNCPSNRRSPCTGPTIELINEIIGGRARQAILRGEAKRRSFRGRLIVRERGNGCL